MYGFSCTHLKTIFPITYQALYYEMRAKVLEGRKCKRSLKVEELITNFRFTTELGQTLSSQKKRFIRSFLGLFHLFDSIIHEYCQ